MEVNYYSGDWAALEGAIPFFSGLPLSSHLPMDVFSLSQKTQTKEIQASRCRPRQVIYITSLPARCTYLQILETIRSLSIVPD